MSIWPFGSARFEGPFLPHPPRAIRSSKTPRVPGCHVLPECPYAIKQRLMGMPLQMERAEIFKRNPGCILFEFATTQRIEESGIVTLPMAPVLISRMMIRMWSQFSFT